MGRAAGTVPLAAVGCVYLAVCFLIFDSVEEDAFIYFRIASHLADGHGFVFNRGGPPVEASSSLLWQGLLAGFAWLRLDLVIAAKTAGVACGALLLGVVHRLGRLLVSDPWAAAAPALFTVLSAPFAAWVQLGLETPLHALLVVSAAWFCAEPRLARFWWVPPTLLLASRPEGFLYLAGLLPFFAIERRRWRDLLPGLGIIAAAFLALLVFRLLYFRDFVPQPFYLKFDHGHEVGAQNFRSVFLGMHLYLLALPLLWVGWRRSFWSRSRLIVASFLVVVLAWNYDLHDGKLFFRHFVPALPLFYLLCVAGLERALAPTRLHRPLLLGACALAVLLLGVQARVPSRWGSVLPNPIHAAVGPFVKSPGRYVRAVLQKIDDPSATTFLDLDGGIGHNWQVRVGEFLGRNYPPGTVIAYDQMGQTPWYAGVDRDFVDLLGLTDQTIGYYVFGLGIADDPPLALWDRVAATLTHWVYPDHLRPVSAQQALDHVFDGTNPDVVLLNRNFTRVPSYLGALLLGDARFAARYERQYVIGEVIDVYGRKGAAPGELVPARGLPVRRTGPAASLPAAP